MSVLTEPEQEFAGTDVKGFVDAFSILAAQELRTMVLIVFTNYPKFFVTQ
ncbi:MAG TPA: hypothetical protein VNX28_02750 [Gemmataceae bacterium]|nr:hypothetical protein [Gemmataceae bacterium]